MKSKLFEPIGRFIVASIVFAGVATMAFTVPSPGLAYADTITPPPVPDKIHAPAGNKLFHVGHAVGTYDFLLPAPSYADGQPTARTEQIHKI